jgi:hypothetical protein
MSTSVLKKATNAAWLRLTVLTYNLLAALKKGWRCLPST